MTLDDIEKLSRYIADNNGMTTDTPDHQLALGDRVKLARAVLAMLPVVRAAGPMRDGHEGCVTNPPCGACFRCDFDAEVDSLRSSMARLAGDV